MSYEPQRLYGLETKHAGRQVWSVCLAFGALPSPDHLETPVLANSSSQASETCLGVCGRKTLVSSSVLKRKLFFFFQGDFTTFFHGCLAFLKTYLTMSSFNLKYCLSLPSGEIIGIPHVQMAQNFFEVFSWVCSNHGEHPNHCPIVSEPSHPLLMEQEAKT